MDTEQPDFYEIVGRPTVDDIMGGFNGTIFAYGQTGAGKSFSMMGKEGRDAQGNLLHPELAGIIPRAAEQVFQTIASEVRGIEFEISVSYLEVYKEVICDLLDPSKVNLKVREHPHRGVYVDHLTEEAVATEADIGTLLRIGDEHQHVSSTGMNSVSSACALGTDCADCGPRRIYPPPPPMPPPVLCSDTCAAFGNGECQDGGPSSISEFCALGTDCSDCACMPTRTHMPSYNG